MDLGRALYRLAAEQHGLLARRQMAAERGTGAANHLTASPGLERLDRGVYAVRGGAIVPTRDALVAALRCGPHAVLTGGAALVLTAEVHPAELAPTSRRRRRDERAPADRPPGRPVPFTVLVPPRRGPGAALPWLQRDAHTAARQTVRHGEIRIATAVDALIDLVRYGPPLPSRTLRSVHDRLRWRGELHPGELTARCTALAAPDAVRSHELLSLDATRATGPGERELGRLLARFDPAPEPEVWITPYRRVDWLFRALQVGVEYQGRADHDHADGRELDRTRDEEVALAGYSLVYVTAEDLRAPRDLLARIAAALTSRAVERGVAAPLLTASA